MRKLLAGPLLIALGLLFVACGDNPTLLPTDTATATPAASSANAVSPTPRASAIAVSPTPPASAAPAVSPTETPSEAELTLLLSTGTYAVGTALPAGAYQGQSLREGSRYQISTDPKGKNAVAESPQLTGQFSLTLKKGQYLEVTGVMKITKVN
jgi:hypothetical protein